MCTPKIISSFAPKIRIIIIKTSDCQLSVHNNIITVHRNLVYSLADFNFCGTT